MTLSKKTISLMTINIVVLSITTASMATFNVTLIHNLKTLSIEKRNATLSIT
jgi:hypothetical protein